MSLACLLPDRSAFPKMLALCGQLANISPIVRIKFNLIKIYAPHL
jgi:hypothetical protein